MPSTRPLDDEHEVVVRYDGKGGSLHRATAEIYPKGENRQMGPVFEGEGRTMTSAEDRALAAARSWFFNRPRR